jgi:catechol 2,3-dioxygenase-like lactoylglutathione lyase family enzyme
MKIKKGNVTVMVSDFDRAVRFYVDTLGLTLRSRYASEWAEVEADGFTIGLHPARPGQAAVANDALSIGLEVDDIDEAVAELTRRGVAFPRGVKADGAVKLAAFTDPDGTPLYVCQVVYGAKA